MVNNWCQWDRYLEVLSSGPKTPAEMATAIFGYEDYHSREAAKATLQRMKRAGRIHRPYYGVYALLTDTYPNRGKLLKRLSHLKERGLTLAEIQELFDVSSGKAREWVYNLKKQGHNIITIRLSDSTRYAYPAKYVLRKL